MRGIYDLLVNNIMNLLFEFYFGHMKFSSRYNGFDLIYRKIFLSYTDIFIRPKILIDGSEGHDGPIIIFYDSYSVGAKIDISYGSDES